MGFSEIKIDGVVPFRNARDVRVAFHNHEKQQQPIMAAVAFVVL